MQPRQALRADLPSIVDIWVEAFAGDPYLRWVQPDDAGWPDFGREWMSFIAELGFERGHCYLVDDAAILWIPPDLSLVSPDDVTRGHGILARHAGQARADDALACILEARGHALEEPHWTLQYLGVRPAKQGSGLGAEVASPILRQCDEQALSCWLVSSNARNVSFYERLGFAVDAEVATPDPAVVLRPMHRDPAAAAP
jgi:GNAT superfamily N-acetyltransferase